MNKNAIVSQDTLSLVAKIFLYVFSFLFILPSEHLNCQESTDLSLSGPYKTGSIEFTDLTDPSQNNRQVPIKVHYPIKERSSPLIIYSHGGGGNWDANYAQAMHLASHGFIVLCPEHVGSNTDDLVRGLRIRRNLEFMTRDTNEVLARPKDISYAINKAEQWNTSHPILREKIDLEKIGVAGHSFGAFTALVICGARPALNWLKPIFPPGHGLGPDLSDKRVKACVALSPQGPGEPFFIESSYSSINRPILGISGTKDTQQKSTPENRLRFFELLPPDRKIFIWLTNADHLAFSDSTGSDRRGLKSATRESVQPIVRAATLSFFREVLLAKKEEARFLKEDYLRRYLTRDVPAMEIKVK